MCQVNIISELFMGHAWSFLCVLEAVFGDGRGLGPHSVGGHGGSADCQGHSETLLSGPQFGSHQGNRSHAHL